MRAVTSVTGLFTLLFAILVGFGVLNLLVTALILDFDGAPSINEAGRLRAQSQQLALAARAADRGNEAYRAQLLNVLERTNATFELLRNGNPALGVSPLEGDQRIQLERLWLQWQGMRGRAEGLLAMSRGTPQFEEQVADLQARSEAFLVSADELVRDVVASSQGDVRHARRNVVAVNVVLGLAALLVSAMAWYLSWRLVFLPVGRLMGLTQALAAGQLHRRFGPRYTPGDIGRLGRAFDAMAESLERQQMLERQAMSDELTGLLNRRGFLRSLASVIELAERSELEFTVCFVDVDQFKAINDSYGHAAGDEALRDVAASLLAAFRRGDVVARIAGDEFAVIALGTPSSEHARIRGAIEQALRAQQAKEPRPYRLTVSVGAVSYFNGATADALLRLADEQMYERKRERRQPAA
jgi:diguanylate cyclase (GGDEF)-like protein